MDDHTLAADAGQQKQHFTSPAPLTSNPAPALRRSERIKNAIQSSNASSGARKRKRPSSADAVSRPAAKTTRIESKSGKSRRSQDKTPSLGESHNPQDSASPYPSEIAPVNSEEQPFRLFDLPDELWSNIGKMIIDNLEVIELNLPDYERSPWGVLPKLVSPAILRTCSALRKELSAHYYSSNKIQVTLHERGAVQALRPYLQAIGSDARRQLDGFIMTDRVESADSDADAELDAPHDLSSAWGVELVLSMHKRDRCDECGLDHADWKITFL
ncbi:unnamed protein product [Zymoseptoria tritici ST99CH_1A5]|uniref:Uncharacterized protein n=1 Tax=Zymoseptoria tritici ST99CH_1A5 TaxID=1276529 RepID=A0A1Y6LI66_ZYMTR|nr:unnamed protein product [Zymoseptoria tritici ST99CH_1A5]